MSIQKRRSIANLAIIGASLVGGGVLTLHFAPDALTAAPATNTSTTSSGSQTSSQGGSTTTTTASGSGTATSDDIPYQFGDIQLTVTKANGKITKIDYGNSTASAGRDQAFPYLVQYAIQAQGSSFSNVSGATYTTDAFKQALDSAISKLG